jgi:tetratricopeptide (TPR) repeat protein
LERDKARAQEMLGEALEREMNDSMAHFAMGMLRRIQNRLNDSQIELETAIALDRNNARALQQLGVTLMCLGEPEDAFPQIERAIRLNPHDPNIASYYWAAGSAELVSGRVDDAASLLTKARAANPRLYFIHLWLAGSLALKGDLGAARSAVAESLELRPEVSSLARLARRESLLYQSSIYGPRRQDSVRWPPPSRLPRRMTVTRRLVSGMLPSASAPKSERGLVICLAAPSFPSQAPCFLTLDTVFVGVRAYPKGCRGR